MQKYGGQCRLLQWSEWFSLFTTLIDPALLSDGRRSKAERTHYMDNVLLLQPIPTHRAIWWWVTSSIWTPGTQSKA
jgi:hypothetical protein